MHSRTVAPKRIDRRRCAQCLRGKERGFYKHAEAFQQEIHHHGQIYSARRSDIRVHPGFAGRWSHHADFEYLERGASTKTQDQWTKEVPSMNIHAEKLNAQ